MQSSSSSQFLPELNANRAPEESYKSAKTARVSIQTQTSPPSAGSDLPPLVILPNSALVHQRASKSVSNHLAVASMNAGASLPLMIGGRSKCVVNLLEHEQAGPAAQQQQNQMVVASPSPLVAGPQNTAARAEQRRQNMAHISVVRPVVNTTQQSNLATNSCSPMSYEPFGHTNAADQAHQKQARNSKTGSLIDDWMTFDRNINSKNEASGILDELILTSKLNGFGLGVDPGTNWSHVRNSVPVSRAQEFIKSEQEMRQQILILRREEHELNRGIMKQHHFVVCKIEERKRYLQIIQSVWVQRDFKHAIEKMIDIYHQGLIFAQDTNEAPLSGNNTALRQAKLKSLNASLVVDVISIIILRPKLWTLEVCQMLLPIVNHDLLIQTRREHEYYVEVGLKAIKLVLTHFSSILKSTFESLKESNKLVGIDLSREDRVNKCLACYKLLLEAQAIITTTSANYKPGNICENASGQSCKLSALYHEVQSMCAALRSSINLDPNQLARRFHNER